MVITMFMPCARCIGKNVSAQFDTGSQLAISKTRSRHAKVLTAERPGADIGKQSTLDMWNTVCNHGRGGLTCPHLDFSGREQTPWTIIAKRLNHMVHR